MVPSRSELPRTLPRRQLILIGKPAKWAVLACPCGRDHAINLNLGNIGTSRWTVSRDEGVTITPSIDVQDATGRCHFWLREGRVHWVQPPRSKALPRQG